MSRYTKTDLQQDLERLNQALEESGSVFRLKYGGRYGYSAVDATRTDATHSGIEFTVATGTPKECYQAALIQHYEWINKQLRQQLGAN